jgi:hypothetical protein
VAIDRVRLRSTGFAGGDGFTNFYFTSATGANLAALRAMFDAIKALLPTTVRYVFPANGDTIDETDGHLLGGWSAAAPADVVGTAGGAYSAPTGFLIDWKIAGVVDGHRPIAKTFVVPASGAAMGLTGGILSSAVTTVNAAALAFLSASAGFSLWHRPVKASAGPPPVAARPGGVFAIVSGSCNPKAVVLRSRRD